MNSHIISTLHSYRFTKNRASGPGKQNTPHLIPGESDLKCNVIAANVHTEQAGQRAAGDGAWSGGQPMKTRNTWA